MVFAHRVAAEQGKLVGRVAAQQLAREHKVPVVVEIFLERITNIAMGTDIDKITEHNELATTIDDSPTAALLFD